MITKLLRHLHTSSTLPHAFSKFVGSQTSPAKSRLTRSPVKSLPSPAQSPVKFAPKSVNVIVRMAPTSGKEPDIEYRNPDEISLGSSEDVEKAGPDSDPQLLIESIDDYVNCNVFLPCFFLWRNSSPPPLKLRNLLS